MTAQNRITARQAATEIGVRIYVTPIGNAPTTRRTGVLVATVTGSRPAAYGATTGIVLITDMGETPAVPAHQTFGRVDAAPAAVAAPATAAPAPAKVMCTFTGRVEGINPQRLYAECPTCGKTCSYRRGGIKAHTPAR